MNTEALNKIFTQIQYRRREYAYYLDSKKNIMNPDDRDMTRYFYNVFLQIKTVSDLEKRLLQIAKEALTFLQTSAFATNDRNFEELKQAIVMVKQILTNFIKDQDIGKLAQSLKNVRDNKIYKDYLRILVNVDLNLEELWKYSRYYNNSYSLAYILGK